MDILPSTFNRKPDAFDHFSVEIEGHADPDLVVDTVARAFKPHRMSIAEPARSLDAAFRSLKVGNLQMFYLQYGARVDVDPGTLDDFTLIQMPIHGFARYVSGAEEVMGGPGTAAVLSPREATRLHFPADLRQIIVRLDQKALERACVEHLDALPGKAIRFHPTLDLGTPAGVAWRSALEHIVVGNVAFPALLQCPSYAARCERMLIDTLLFAHPHNLSDHFRGGQNRRTITPAYVRRAEDYMRAHIADVTSVDEISRAVGVSSRALFYAFRQTHDQTPMAYLRELRLKAVHAELKSGDPAAIRLTDVAMRWGFAHYGHFASHYRRRFGVRPQDTLHSRGS
ncbi:AraC family transcriptional regulator [Paraburkholderia sp. SUR17]|uniref:AraC family transcriptional regulator n=1 Tax=Paraburkholderia sp. SUR17 TaxID=3034358 RepID=UPI0024085A90|nr:AraC family transcriptional regulator [Paraburkholderia sp. SUR17]WEY37588.1 AraC family transcriptional regulator [Paraburkholderia sp. SUR17]